MFWYLDVTLNMSCQQHACLMVWRYINPKLKALVEVQQKRVLNSLRQEKPYIRLQTEMPLLSLAFQTFFFVRRSNEENAYWEVQKPHIREDRWYFWLIRSLDSFAIHGGCFLFKVHKPFNRWSNKSVRFNKSWLSIDPYSYLATPKRSSPDPSCASAFCLWGEASEYRKVVDLLAKLEKDVWSLKHRAKWYHSMSWRFEVKTFFS